MRHCTVCGAEAREGAKFCTSCGARLQTTGMDASASSGQTATLPSVTDEPSESARTDEDRDADASVSDVTTTYVPDSAETEGRADTPFTSSWPAPDDAPATDEPSDRTEGDDAHSGAEEPASWASAFVTPEPSRDDSTTDAADSGWTGDDTQEELRDDIGTDADRDEGRFGEESWTWAGGDEPASDVGLVDDASRKNMTTENDQHGASTWGSWAPAVNGPSTLHEHDDDPAGQIRGLLNELADRIDRLVNPATVGSREIDPDQLADQLDRWARTVPDVDELLDVVRDVRKAPRDLDAITRLVDRAGDLELLVRHYQSITTSSGQWAAELRRPRQDAVDDVSAKPKALPRGELTLPAVVAPAAPDRHCG